MTDSQRSYFELAYRTGSDLWSHIPYQRIALQMLPPLHPGALVLDVGAGRGRWAFTLVEHNYRVLGIDYVPHIVDRANDEVKYRGISEKVRFLEGDVFDIPFTDQSFDMVTDIGLLQHMNSADWGKYVAELGRVLHLGGYILSVQLSRETPRYLGFTPKSTPDATMEKFGVSYHFFEGQEVADIYSKIGCSLVAQRVEFFDARSDPSDSVALVFSLLRKDS